MISNIYWIEDPKLRPKKMGTMARPRGNDWLEDEVMALKNSKIDCLISLLERSEDWELGLEKEAELCQKWGIEFINFPIRDVYIPTDEEKFISLAQKLADYLNKDKKLVIHCRMGIGRSSILAAAIMISLAYEAKNVFEIISKYRKLKVPDTDEQRNWILSIEDRLKNHKSE